MTVERCHDTGTLNVGSTIPFGVYICNTCTCSKHHPRVNGRPMFCQLCAHVPCCLLLKSASFPRFPTSSRLALYSIGWTLRGIFYKRIRFVGNWVIRVGCTQFSCAPIASHTSSNEFHWTILIFRNYLNPIGNGFP